MNKTRRHSARRERGAALIVAIGVLTLLLVIALTFFRASIGDMRTAENTVNGVRAELLADGATAVAIGFLNHDRLVHPSLTSLDSAWRSYFNGTWMVGKPYLWAQLRDPNTANGVHPLSPLRGGVPEVDAFRVSMNDGLYIPRVDYALGGNNLPAPNIQPQNYSTLDSSGAAQNIFVTTADLADPNFLAPPALAARTKFPPLESMYLDPRLTNIAIFPEDQGSLETSVFDDIAPAGGRPLSLRVVPTNAGNNQTLPYEQIHFWTDVDNDGDGLKDSMWLPIGADRFFPNDGLDNDLDGLIDAADTDGEPGVFMYRGDTDGIDNDGNGLIDEPGEHYLVIFTVPTPFVAPDGTPVTPTAAEFAAMGIQPSDTVLFEGQRDPNTGQFVRPIGFMLGTTTGGVYTPGPPIFTRDNDYDLVDDEPVDCSHYLLTPAALDALRTNNTAYPYYNLLVNVIGTASINQWIAAGALPGTRPEVRGAFHGETVTELVGRMAILIKDESSKVSINAAGGLSWAVFPNTADLPLTRAFSEGVGPHEYELRVLPGIGAALSNKIWTMKMGGPKGGRAMSSVNYGSVVPQLTNSLDLTSIFVTQTGNYAYDVSLPGYGGVDDNANLLQVALSHVNVDGLPRNASFPAFDPNVDSGLLGGRWKGIDEPGEYQRFRPLRNLIAEKDDEFRNANVDGNFDGIKGNFSNGDTDNNGNGVTDEIGELGDTYYRTHQQLKLISGIGSGIFDGVRNLVTAHSTDRNERHFESDEVLSSMFRERERQTTGLKKDLNLARPQDVARAVTRDWTYLASGPERWMAGFAANPLGAVSTRVGALTDTDFGQPGTVAFLAGLRQENTTVLTTSAIMGLPNTANPNPPEVPAFTMLADAELRAHQLAASIKDVADRDNTRSEDDEIFADDTWWRTLALPFEGNPDPIVANAALLARTQRIYYTTAGQESIRINELMVRPVRRFETEAITNLDASDANIGNDRGFDPNRFVPHNGTYPPATQAAAEAIEMQGFRMRVTTTGNAITAYNNDPQRNNGAPLTSAVDDVAASWARTSSSGLLGLQSAWTTYRAYIDVRDTVNRRSFRVPDVVEFSFQATQELPAGRYYVKVNTQYVDATGALINSVVSPSDFGFAVKIGNAAQDWFADVMNIAAYAQGGQVYNAAWRTPALLGDDTTMGGSGGMAFLQGDTVFRALDAGNPYSMTVAEFANKQRLEPNLGFTIEVPGHDPAATTVNTDQFVHIALRSFRDDGVRFVVNYIDFSQEPDHEWVEIANVSNEAVDLSGWQLAVEHHPLGFGPMTIPNGTVIAPKGLLLLGTNKFDYAYNADPNTGAPILLGPNPADRDLGGRGPGFFANGIGLATEDSNGPSLGIFAGVSVPQILYNTSDVNQGSEFYRPGLVPTDFVDLDGDGIRDAAGGPDDTVTSTIDPVQLGPVVPTKPWDRIVELIVPELVPQSGRPPFTVSDIGRIVLGGGILPNRPEYDGVDNDGDNAILEHDGIDNNGDGQVDEPGEGIDEGRVWRENHLRDATMPVPGAYHREIARYKSFFFDFDLVNAPGSVPAYWRGDPVTGAPNPPQWKEFMERRNFPGDNVIVTLYEGPAKNNQVADRVTYTERDVENRQIDDILFVNDFDTLSRPPGKTYGDLGVLVGDPGVPVPLDNIYPSFWPEDTMGIDFARSLERKLPEYTGDRFGTQNRFQATDGSYDDWSDSAGRWERTLNNRNFPIDMVDRLDPAFIRYAEFVHAISGTPLRQNVAARYALSNQDRRNVFNRAEFANHPLVSPGSALLAAHTSRTTLFSNFIDSVTGEEFLIDASSPNISNSNVTRSDETYDEALIGQKFDGATAPIDFFKDTRAFLGDTGTTDSVSLNAGQATVIQVLRGSAGAATAPGAAWPVISGVLTGAPPQTWSPLMMFEMLNGTPSTPNDSVAGTAPPYGYARQYLFQPMASLPATVDNARWPMALRTALYASRNFDNFDVNDSSDGAQAVFVWDGDDGLENGEYDLYVVTTEDLSPLVRADNVLRTTPPPPPPALPPPPSRLLTDTTDIGPSFGGARSGVGAPFIAATQRTANREVYLDVEVFRDSNGDRKAWAPDLAPGDFLRDAQLQRGQAAGVPFESFGLMTGARPDADGVIHYGVVRVENNFLAVSLRNRSAPGVVARFSRVILAARNKTPGRININTTETRRIANGNTAASFFNPLTGLPGMLERVADSSAIGPGSTLTDTAGGTLITNAPTAESPEDLAAQTLARHITEQKLRLSGEAPDGRYYELTTDLLADAHFASLPAAISPTGFDAFRPPLIAEYDNYLEGIDPGARRPGAIGEAAYRFRRMQNLITTKSEVFEILVTVQAGYGTDTNGDGRINWRDDKEFTATAEKTARTIYER